MLCSSLLMFFCYVCLHGSNVYAFNNATYKEPTVFIAILARNKAHTLPYFLTLLQNQNYPKDRLTVWLRSDHNSDATAEMVRAWADSVRGHYHSLEVDVEDKPHAYPGETGPAHWPTSRFTHVIGLREEALERARHLWADYALMLDADVLLTDADAIRELVYHDLPLVAPMLRSDGLYANFWAGMTDEYYYQRTEEYRKVLNRERAGCHAVPMVHSCVLVDLRRRDTELLTYRPERLSQLAQYDPPPPHDDIITFALSARAASLPLHVCNERRYGYVPVPLEQGDSPSRDLQQLVNLRLEALADGAPVDTFTNISPPLRRWLQPPAADRAGFDRIYMINLRRRPERRRRMQACFRELGLLVDTMDAVDGKSLNESTLSEIRMLPGYEDPYHKRPMTLGEIGCFLSHHELWKRTASAGHDTVLVLEDDIRFEPFFRERLQRLLEELRQLPDWDLVYLGRKRLQDQEEPWVEGSGMLVRAGYSYWTLGYALNGRGARKLLAAGPLVNMLPVDEYLPILFDRHPRADWKQHFPQRDLHALSASPLLLFPTHYTGESGYVSDTEDSDTLKPPRNSHHASEL